jgi:hypothetical protein
MSNELNISGDLQQIITNAVQSALSQGGIKSNTEAVSTVPSSLAAELSKKACERRLRNLKPKR